MNQHLCKHARLTSFLRKALKPFFAVCALAPVFAFHTASAQTFWDANGGAGGTGTWDTTTSNWGAAPNQAAGLATWVNGANTANFSSLPAGAPGAFTVTVGTTGPAVNIVANGLIFTENGYVVTDNAVGGGTGTLTLTGAATITANPGVTAAIAAVLNDLNAGGTDTLTFTGGGIIQLSGANNGAYFGSPITINANTTVVSETPVANPFVSPLPNTDYVVNGNLQLNDNTDGNSPLIASLSGTNAAATVTNTATASYGLLTVGGGATSFSSYAGIITDTTTTIESPNHPTPIGALGLTVIPAAAGTYTLVLTGKSNTYHGMTVVGSDSSGFTAVLQAGITGTPVANAFSPNSFVDVRFGGTLNLNGANQAIAGLTSTINGAFIGNGTITNNAAATATLTIGNALSPGTYTSNANLMDGVGKLALATLANSDFTQVLAGINTYSGGTTVNTGTGITAGSTSGLSKNSAFNLAGVSATLDINGYNSTIGSLTGTGAVTNGAAIGGHAGNATLTVGNDGTSTTYSGQISDGTSGTLALTKIGGGVLTMDTLASVYTGPTTVNGGTLQAGAAAASNGGFSKISAFVVNTGGTLDINGQTTTIGSLASLVGTGGIVTNSSATAGALTTGFNNTSTTYAGIIQNGAGKLSLTKIGSGVFTLTGPNTYSGGTNINQGTLSFASGSLGTIGAVQFTGNSTLQWNGSNTQDISGRLGIADGITGTIDTNGNNIAFNSPFKTVGAGTGTGGFTKIGAGALTLNTDNTYSGGTTLMAGSLIIGSSNALGRGNVTVTGGALQAGGANMNIKVGGAYTQSAGGELDLRIGGTTAGTFDQLTVGGAAALAGKLSVTSFNGFAPVNGQSVTVITAGGGVNGTFQQVTGNLSNFPLVKLTIDYLPNSVVLDFGQIPFVNVGTMLNLKLTPNEKAVSFALDHLASNAAATRLTNFLDSLPMQSLPGAFDLIAPEEYGAIYEISRSAAKMEAVTIQNRLDEVHATAEPTGAPGPSGPSDYKGSKEVMPPPDKRLGVFANGSGEFVTVGDSSNAKGFNFGSGAATVGIDYRVTEHFLAGILLNYTGTTADLTGGGRINANAFHGGAYASVFGSGAYVNAFVGGAGADYDVTRTGLGSSVRGSTSSGDFNALIATGYDAHCGGFTYGPVASFQYTYTGVDSFNESGSLAPLHVNAGHGDSLLTNVGARATYDWHIGSMVLVPEVRATWQHEYGDTFDEISATMLLGSPAFTVTSSPIGRDSLVVNAGFTLRITPDFSAYAFYDGELARTNYQANNVMVGFRASF